jgi:hypothetical protein
VKTFISRVVILFTALLFTNSLFAQEKDALSTKAFGIQLAGGSQVNLKGIYVSGGLFYTKNKVQYTLQFNFTGYKYVTLNDLNYSWFIENTNSVSALIGYKVPVHKWEILLDAGLNIGVGRFITNANSYNAGFIISDNASYFKSGFLGPTFNCFSKYNFTDKINIGLSFTTFLNYYFQYQTSYPYGSNHQYKFRYLNNYYGMQISIGYKIK